MKNVFILEHLEPNLGKWTLIEYKNISRILGKNALLFANIKNKKDIKKLSKYGKIFLNSVKNIDFLNSQNSCILDPESPTLLSPKIAKKYKYFIFGGILGDYPPKKRTEKELSLFLPKISKYNIGKEQMSTDNAVYVVKKMINEIPLNKIHFIDSPEIKINDIESTILPYRYAIVKNKPFISKNLIKYLKKH